MEIKTLINEDTIQKRVNELGSQISRDYENKELVIVSILRGAVFFVTDLAKRINADVKLEFVEVSSYNEGTESSGNIVLNKEIKDSIKNKDVLVVEDIVDTGRTLNYLLQYLKTKNPRSIKFCSLLNKPSRRVIPVDIDYIGFDVEDKFIVGYGLDYNQCYRNLPYIAYIEQNI